MISTPTPCFSVRLSASVCKLLFHAGRLSRLWQVCRAASWRPFFFRSTGMIRQKFQSLEKPVIYHSSHWNGRAI